MLTKLLPFVAFASLVAARNNALDVNTNCQNDKCVDEHITTHGSDFLYAICAVMGVTALGCIVGGYMQTKERRSNRIFWWITAAINFTACIAYFTMGKSLLPTWPGCRAHLVQVPTWAGLPLTLNSLAPEPSSVVSTVRSSTCDTSIGMFGSISIGERALFN